MDNALRFRPSAAPLASEAVDLIVVPVFANGELPSTVAGEIGEGVAGRLQAMLGRRDLRRIGSSCWIAAELAGPDVLAISVGPKTDDGCGVAELRLAARLAGRAAEQPRVACLLAFARPGDPESVTSVVENWLVGSYRYGGRADEGARRSVEVVICGGPAKAIEFGVILGEAANLARELINTPPSELTPLDFAERCCALANQYGFTAKIRVGTFLVDGGFAGLVAVGRSSANPPVLVEIERGDLAAPHLALVGKGITFDSGGLSLKPSRGMLTMKADMSAAANIVSAFVAAERLGLPLHVRGYLACAENMPAGNAMRVGDVLRHRNGLTTEVVDTDCEGRLVLSDVLAYAAEAAPTHVIDMATLTSSTGLGPEMWAVLGTSPHLVGGLVAAGSASGEPGWELPLWAPYAKRLESDVADLRNTDPTVTSPFGAVLAAQYLRRFAGDSPWAHIDLGLTVMRDVETDGWSVGANGNGSRTLARFLASAA